jgi:hypothetical protein
VLERKNMTIQITQDDVDYALAPSIWDLGNQVLYSLCQDHPGHDHGDAIVAKVWLIGRSYAAAIERRKNAKDTGKTRRSNNLLPDCIIYIPNPHDCWCDDNKFMEWQLIASTDKQPRKTIIKFIIIYF